MERCFINETACIGVVLCFCYADAFVTDQSWKFSKRKLD